MKKEVKKTTKKSTKGNIKKKSVSKKKQSSKKLAFTLIELLAVIIILGVLMLVAIPSISRYIDGSRKESYVTTAKEYIKGATHLVNSGQLDVYDPDTTYYIPTSCIGLETGGSSPYGEFDPAYIIVTYNNDSYEYYWTSRDTTGMGVKGIISSNDLKSSSIVSGIASGEIKADIGVGERGHIKVLSINDCKSMEDGSVSSNIPENGGTPVIEFLNGKTKDNTTTGDMVRIGTEEFYVIKRDGNDVVLLAKYLLKVGYTYDGPNSRTGSFSSSDPGYGLQSSEATGDGNYVGIGTVPFSYSNYWENKVGPGLKYSKPYCTSDSNTDCAYVYDSNSFIYSHVNNYKNYLESLGANVKEARLMTFGEAIELGCSYDNDSCRNAPAFVRSATYWTGSAAYSGRIVQIIINGRFNTGAWHSYAGRLGIRPVIVI